MKVIVSYKDSYKRYRQPGAPRSAFEKRMNTLNKRARRVARLSEKLKAKGEAFLASLFPNLPV